MWARANHSLLVSVSPDATVDIQVKFSTTKANLFSRRVVLEETSQTLATINFNFRCVHYWFITYYAGWFWGREWLDSKLIVGGYVVGFY